MNIYVSLLLCATAALLFKSLETAYFQAPSKELKRRAAVSRPDFRKLYLVSRHPLATRLILGSLKFIFVACAVVIISNEFDMLEAVTLLAVLLALLKLLSLKKFIPAQKIAVFIAPYFSEIVSRLEPLLKKGLSLFKRKKLKNPGTDLYEIEDLKDLIAKQQKAPNNRIDQAELTSVLNALEFGAKKIRDCMVPRNRIHFVSAKDAVGPILLSELHKSGFNSFPVKGNSEHDVEGILYMHNLAEHTEGGLVGQFMDKKITYVEQDKPLDVVLQAYSKTGRQEFIVTDENERVVGMISLGDVVEVITKYSVKSV